MNPPEVGEAEVSLPAGDPTRHLAYAFGVPACRGAIRTVPEDFRVEERLGFHPAGRGAHTLLQVEKRGANSAWVAGRIAALAGVRPQEVGYAGLKDRHALTRQWFSVTIPDGQEPDWLALEDQETRLLAVARHTRKLRRGDLTGNAFTLVVRGVTGDGGQLRDRLVQVGQGGVPNYFGPQRFGHDGGNLQRALVLFGGRLQVHDRQERGLYLSAARSFLFNEPLSRRVAAGNWLTPLPGEVIQLADGPSLITVAAPSEAICGRVARGELLLTGPLWGRGPLPSSHAVQALEQEATAPWPLLREGIEAAGMDQERRPLRLVPEAFAWSLTDDTLELTFALPAGAFATSVLRELLEVEDVRAGARQQAETGL